MLEQREKLWDYDAIEQGQAGNPTVVQITPENISKYALVALNQDPKYRRHGADQDYDAALVAMPTMVLTYAPLLREDIAEVNGFVALEQSQSARRQTPFAKCEIRWSGPVQPGDTITASRRVLEKYERRGSKFVTFRVDAANQHGQRVAEYDYTCIFEYAQGQKQAPKEPGTALWEDSSPPPIETEAQVLSFDSISVGDRLASLAVTESQEIINRKNDFRMAGRPMASNIHTDEEFARQNIFGGTVNSGPATMSYVDQMLQLSFPLRAFYGGGRLLMRAIEPFRAGDTVTFQGEVTGKHPTTPNQGERMGGVVECRVKGINQRGDLISLSDARLSFTE